MRHSSSKKREVLSLLSLLAESVNIGLLHQTNLFETEFLMTRAAQTKVVRFKVAGLQYFSCRWAIKEIKVPVQMGESDSPEEHECVSYSM